MPVIGRRRLVVLLEQVVAEIVFEVSPDAVNVVGVVLGVVVLDQERRPLDAVVVGHSSLDAAGPREADFVDARLEDLAQVVPSQFGAKPLGVEDDDRVQEFLLLGVRSGTMIPAGSSGFALRAAREMMSLGASS